MGKIGKTACIILAAGRGTRMKSSMPKVLHRIAGRTMIEHVLDIAKPFRFRPTVVVTGYKAGDVAQYAGGSRTVRQIKLAGSGDAVMRARGALGRYKGDVVILYGDTPLVQQATLQKLVIRHKATDAACTVLTARLKDPSGYGRIVRDEGNEITGIVEEQEASLYDKGIDEVNVGAYCFKADNLFKALKKVRANNKKKEYYLTDTIDILRKNNLKIESLCADSEEEAMGVNSREELSKAEDIVRRRAQKKFLDNGVTIIDPLNTYIDVSCRIGRDTVIRPYTIIEKDVTIGSNCTIGPFARIRPGTRLADKVEIGNFAELTRSRVGIGTKIKHQSYIGDAVIGKKVNIGAGTITANFDGKNKHKTVIKDGAFIGSGTIFVAPVIVGKKAVTGAGSVITKKTKVPDNSVVVGIPARILKKKKKKGD